MRGSRASFVADPSVARIAAIAVGILAVTLAAPSVQALTITPDPMSWSRQTALLPGGSVDLVSQTTGVPGGGTVQVGSTGGSDITFVFDVSTLFDGGGNHLFLGIDSTGTISGAGTVASPDADLLFSAPLSGAPAGSVMVGDPNSSVGELVMGQAYDDIFISFSSVSAGDTLTVFPCNILGCIPPASVTLATATIVVPEPSTAVLLVLGLLALRPLRELCRRATG